MCTCCWYFARDTMSRNVQKFEKKFRPICLWPKCHVRNTGIFDFSTHNYTNKKIIRTNLTVEVFAILASFSFSQKISKVLR